MAKVKKPAIKKLAGQSVAFVGKFGYSDMWLDRLKPMVAFEGATTVDPAAAAPNYLVVGAGRGGKPPGDVIKLLKKYPAAVEVDVKGFLQLVCPTDAELLDELKVGRLEDDRWEHLTFMTSPHGDYAHANSPFDLSGADLRGVDLHAAKLETVRMDGADLRQAKAHYTNFGDLNGANLDGLDGENAYLTNLDGCTFRKANLAKCWMVFAHGKKVTGCDFTGAMIAHGQLERDTFTDTVFAGAVLTDGRLENSTFQSCDFAGADLTRLHARKTKFSGCSFGKAKLYRADLRNADLTNADLRNADLRDAVLSGADFTGAKLDGADFAGAVLIGIKFDASAVKKAKNFKPPVARVPGPKLLELAAASAGSKHFTTSAEVDIAEGEFAHLDIAINPSGSWATSRLHRERDEHHDRIDAPNLEHGMLNLADRWPKAMVRLDTVAVKGGTTLKDGKLKDLAVAAWAEAFGTELLSADQIKEKKASQKAAAEAERDALMAKMRAEGPGVWNALDHAVRNRMDLRGIDLSGADLGSLSFSTRDLQGSTFAKAKLGEAELWHCKLQKCDFTVCDQTEAKMSHSKCEGTSFQMANLTGADLTNAKLVGADFTGATLKGATLVGAEYDESIKLPRGFQPPDTMIWKGKIKIGKAKAEGSVDFETFHKGIQNKVDPAKLKKAASML